jgi:hypothetical protein
MTPQSHSFMPRTSKASPCDILRLHIDALASKGDHHREQFRPEDYTVSYYPFNILRYSSMEVTRTTTSLPLIGDEGL